MKFSYSLRKSPDFEIVYRKGVSIANRQMVIYYLENGTGCNRIGISVSKKIGNSVIRHRIKRLIKESYRLNEERFREGVDMVFIARSPLPGMGFDEVEQSFLHLANKAGMLKG